MIELSTHIEYLLFNHNEVSVPQLGTFIVRDVHSKRIEEEGIFLPPYRTLSFHWNEQEAGEEFIKSLSKVHNLLLSEARIMCAEYVDELMQTLSDEGTAAVGTMGYLLRDAQTAQLSFVPLQSGIATPAYYGLDALPFAKLSNDARQHRTGKQAGRVTKVTSLDSDRDTIIIRINRRAFNYVTTVAASIILFFAFTSPFDNPVAEIANSKAETELFLAPKPAAKVNALPKQIVSEPKKVAEVKAETPAAEAIQEPVAAQEPVVTQESAVSQESAHSDYAIVIASAISKKSAVSLAEKLQKQGYKAVAGHVGGMVRVLIPGFNSMDEAYAEIHRMRQASADFSSSWPYRMKEEIEPIN
ncbi:MAG: SPOR domain-containing protein [Bacteroidaceae bacterium]|nr:SPOR domain-containing protein [Bacteroidaceae bacterium]